MLHVLGLKLMISNVCTAEWDLGGFPPWLLTIEPALKLRSSDLSYLSLVYSYQNIINLWVYSTGFRCFRRYFDQHYDVFKVERWWGVVLPKVAPLLYNNGGPIIMVQASSSEFKLLYYILFIFISSICSFCIYMEEPNSIACLAD